MPSEKYTIPREESLLIADENGQVAGSVALDSSQSDTELLLPSGFGDAIIRRNEGVAVPGQSDEVIVQTGQGPPGEMLVAGGFDPNLDTTAIEGMVRAQQDYNKRKAAEMMARERGQEESQRQHDRRELALNPRGFLIGKAQNRLASVDKDSSVSQSADDAKLHLEVLSVIKDPYIQDIKGDDNLYAVLGDMVRGDSWEDREPSGLTIDYDEFVDQLIGSLDATNPKERRAIYDIIGQFDMPIEDQERLLWRMEEKSDYEHNLLAARYALGQYSHNREGVWVKAQTERQKRLKLLVSCSPEAAMGCFDEAMKLARRLVFVTDPHKLPEGRVGIEFEGSQRMEYAWDTSDEWELGWDRLGAREVRKSSDSLSFSSYPQALVEFDEWAADNFIANSKDRHTPRLDRTMHLHLDRSRHHIEPLYGLFDNDSTINDLGTWELRGVMPFQSAAETLAFIELAIHSAEDVDYPAGGHPPLSSASSWRRLLYGHVVRSTKNPNARAAALVALRDPYAMRGFDIEPLIDTYGSDVLGHIRRQPEDFLMTGSASHFSELYGLSVEHNTDRDPQQLYDIVIDPRTTEGARAMIVEQMILDPAAHTQLVQFLLSGSASEECWDEVVYMDDMQLEVVGQLLPVIYDRQLDEFYRDFVVQKAAVHQELASELMDVVRDPDTPGDIRTLIIGAFGYRSDLNGILLELVLDRELPEGSDSRIIEVLYDAGGDGWQKLVSASEDGLLSKASSEYINYMNEE